MSKLEALTKQFGRALDRLGEALSLPENDIVRDSAIQRFEFTLDLAWKTVKGWLEEKKGITCSSPKECFREAYRQKLVEYDEIWLELVDMRNETVHTYKEELAAKVYSQLPLARKHLGELLERLKQESDQQGKLV